VGEKFSSWDAEAAVLIVLAGEGEDEHVLLTQRAAHLNLHRGEVAFPGGKRDATDASLLDTAIREAQEEVGLDPGRVEVMGRLPAGCTRTGIRVAPFVARVPEQTPLEPNLDELESLFWVPTAYLLDDNRVRTDVFEVQGEACWAPVYNYLGYTIWGFTARVLVQFLNEFWSAGIGKSQRNRRVIYQAATKVGVAKTGASKGKE
jgi:8-oxo-dGTP pyrophosphatase MutT (NUDIX family)